MLKFNYQMILDAKQAAFSKQRTILEEKQYEVEELKVKLTNMENSLKSKIKDLAQMQVSSKVNESDSNNELIDRIQQLELQLGKKDIIIAKQDNMIKILENQKRKESENEINPDSANKISELEKIIEAKDAEISNMLAGFERQLKGFHKTLNDQMLEIDQKDELINDLRSTNDVLEKRVIRLKQATAGLKLDDKVDESLENEFNLRTQYSIIKNENQVLQQHLIDIKLKWANSEHEKETIRLDLIDMSEELEELKETLRQYQKD